MLHVMLHMAQSQEPVTSETIARVLQTNPVVVRRTMAGLRDHGYVNSVKGHGGGWTLGRALDDITLLDIYRALEAPNIFSLGWAEDHDNCLIERAVNEQLEKSLGEAQALLLASFGAVTLQDIYDKVKKKGGVIGLG
jgi:Rrf2 family protein